MVNKKKQVLWSVASKAMGKNVKEKKKVESFKRGRRGKRG